MSLYEFLLIVHLLAAVIWVGGGITLHLLGALARRSGSNEKIYEYTRQANWIAPRLYAPLAVVLVVAGTFLVYEAPGADFDQAWINLAYTAWLVSFLLGVLFYPRQQRKLDRLVEEKGVQDAGVVAIFDRVSLVNRIEITILLLVIVDMVLKPGFD